MAANDTTWTDAVISDLRRLWDEGHSTAEIGRRLSVTKNAVVGKVHRLHLPNRPSPISRPTWRRESRSRSRALSRWTVSEDGSSIGSREIRPV